MKKIIVILLVIILITCGCVVTGAVNVNEKHCRLHWTDHYSDISGYVTKFSIPEDGVTCYVYNTGYSGGISCLKDDDDNDTK